MKERTIAIIHQLIIRCPELSVAESSLIKSVKMLRESYRAGGKLMVCGNGGSAADAEHIVGELMKGFLLKRPVSGEKQEAILSAIGDLGSELCENLQGALPALSLVSQSSLISAVSNDTSPGMVYAQQVFGYGNPGDVLIGLSTSGNAQNVVKAFLVAKGLQISTISFTGEGGGELSGVSDISIRAPSSSTPEIQEYHIQLYHALCSMIESEFFDS